MKFQVPETLVTQRLVLRQWQERDWQDFHAYASDEVATAHTYGHAMTEGQTWRTLASMVGHWHLRGYGPYALEAKATGRVVGTVGFWYPTDWPEPEIKWALARTSWGKGYASEAARCVIAAGQKHLPAVRWISFVHEDNKPSIRLAEALGAKLEKTLSFRGAKFHVFRHRKID